MKDEEDDGNIEIERKMETEMVTDCLSRLRLRLTD